MGKNYSRVKRGMVFWFDPHKVYGEPTEYVGYNGKSYKSNIQNLNRPWLVVSNDDGNNTAPTCNIVPITLEDKADIPVHVHFMYEGRKQTVLCEQMRTVDIMALEEYIYSVSDDIMLKVERALQIQYNIRSSVTYADFNLDNTVKHLEDIVSYIIQEKTKAIEAKQSIIPVSQIEDAALQLGQMIEDLVGVKNEQPKQEIPKEQPIPVKQPEQPVEVSQNPPKPQKPDYRGMSAVEKFNARYTQQPTTEPTKQAEADKPKRNTWTPESRQAYLDDCERMSPQEIMKKYGFKSLQSVFQTKYACRNALGKAD